MYIHVHTYIDSCLIQEWREKGGGLRYGTLFCFKSFRKAVFMNVLHGTTDPELVYSFYFFFTSI